MNILRRFPCSKCGECCKRIGIVAPELVDPETGWCKYFDPATNLCTIYEDRPLICNVDRAYDEIFKDKMTRDEWYKENIKYCKKLQNEK